MHFIVSKINVFVGCCFTSVAYAEEAIVIGSKSTDPFSTANLSQWTVGLITILLIIGTIAWLVKRFSHFGNGQVGQMKIVAGLSVGHREKVVLIRAGEQHLLIGVAPGRVQTLHTFAKNEIADTNQPGSFQQSMRDVLTKEVEV
ncbi:MAG: flagellar biosynthetic protein FliO [Piscirickettsiaceae bacterium]|nr:MAG: flagellar biosynthetic protein FliO [Piscirickettsiaceae bacterium]